MAHARTRTKDVSSTEQAILLTAKEVFTELGYEQASMDEVAARAGTTKRTVYNHFASKERLFRDAVTLAAELFATGLPVPDLDAPLEAELARFVEAFAAMVTWRGSVGLQRVVLAEARRFPDLAPALHADAVGRAERVLAEHLASRAARGEVAVGDPLEASRGLLATAAGALHLATLFGAAEPLAGAPGEVRLADDDRAAVRRAVARFTAGLGAPRGAQVRRS